MPDRYFNDSLAGNGRMLCCIDRKGELIRLFWPCIDHYQHVDFLTAGIFVRSVEINNVGINSEGLGNEGFSSEGIGSEGIRNVGIYNKGFRNDEIINEGMLWLHEGFDTLSYNYVEDTNVVETRLMSRDRKLSATITDFVLPEEDVLVRRYSIKNLAGSTIKASLSVYSRFISGSDNQRGVLFDFTSDSLIYYRHSQYLAVAAIQPMKHFQLGNDSYNAAAQDRLYGYESTGMMNEAAFSLPYKELIPEGEHSFDVFICAASTIAGVKKLVYNMKGSDTEELEKVVANYWRAYIRKPLHSFFSNAAQKGFSGSNFNNAGNTGSIGSNTNNPGNFGCSVSNACIDHNFVNGLVVELFKNIGIQPDKVLKLVKRSLLIFSLLADKNNGGLLASAEIDENFTRCGRYGYCWGRDAAFITEALDACGMYDITERFYHWAAIAQDPDGFWHQRYYVDGNIAPSWGLQIDETGTLIHGILRHYKLTGNIGFLEGMWPVIYKAAGFMADFIDRETGLPAPGFDLWEERLGEHAYSAAAVYSGLMAAAEAFRILFRNGIILSTFSAKSTSSTSSSTSSSTLALSASSSTLSTLSTLSTSSTSASSDLSDYPEDLPDKWESIALNIKNALCDCFWKENEGSFIRSIRLKLNPWGDEPSENRVDVVVNKKGYIRNMTLENNTADISLLGLCVPFGVLQPLNEKMMKTAQKLESVLTCHSAGGLYRYENDNYIGGNPWLISTLWMALYHIRTGKYGKAVEYLRWACDTAAVNGFLPEQADRQNGQPAWVLPLTWSHAMFLLVLKEIIHERE